MARDYSQEWQTAKTEFEQITGVKKPKESKGVFNAYGSHTGLTGSLKKATAAAALCQNTLAVNAKDGQKAAKSFEAATKEFGSAKTSYLGVLKKAIDTEIKQRPDPQTKSTYERALKFLSKELEALEKTMKADLAANIQKFDQAAQALSIKEKQVELWSKNIKAAVARANAGAAKVKAKPTVADYNQLFPGTARDITMQLVNARDPKISWSLKGDPDVFLDKLKGWANQNGSVPSRAPPTYTVKDIQEQISKFMKAVKEVDQLVSTRKK